MNEHHSSRRSEAARPISRRRVLGVTALTVVGTGGLLTSAASAQTETTDFGDVAVGSTRIRAITTENPAGRSIEVTDLTIAGTDADQFSVERDDAPFDLGPDESHTVQIRFAPTSTGHKTATVRVDTAIRSGVVAGRLVGTGVEQEAASNSNSESSSDPNSDSSSSSESSSSEADTPADGGEPGSSTDTPSSATTADRSSSSDEPDDSAADSSGGPAETETAADASTEHPAADESIEESTTPDQDTTTPTDTPISDAAAADTAETEASSTADSSAGTVHSPSDDEPEGLFMNFFDVDDDGVITLRDIIALLRRLS